MQFILLIYKLPSDSPLIKSQFVIRIYNFNSI